MVWFYYLVAAGFGLIFGSFFNVCIYRIPRGEGLGERSRCPHCKQPIAWYDNIPVLSFTLLRGRCRRCSKKISWRYPLVELATAGLFVLVYWWSRNAALQMVLSGPEPLEPGVIVPELFIGLLMVSVLIICTGVDISHGIVPNRVTYPGIVVMLALVLGISIYRHQPGRIGLSLLSGAAGGGFLLIAALVYGLLFMKAGAKDSGEGEGGMAEDGGDLDEGEDVQMGMGMGDVKLVFFMGLAVGYFHWYFVWLVILIGSFLGAIGALILRKGRKERFAFAPFLSAGGVIVLIWGQQMIDLYLRLLR